MAKSRMTKSEKEFVQTNFDAFKNKELSDEDTVKYLLLILQKTY